MQLSIKPNLRERGTESHGSYKTKTAELPKDNAFGELGLFIRHMINNETEEMET